MSGPTAFDAVAIVSGTLPTARIADDAITAAKLADTAVTPGSYTAAGITVDAQGRITAAASGVSGKWTAAGSDIYYNSGKVGIGNSAPETVSHITEISGAAARGLTIEQIDSSAAGGWIAFRKARGTPGAKAIIQDGDFIGAFAAQAFDGVDYLTTSAFFGFRVNGAVAADTVPTDILFVTGSSNASRTERFRIRSTGITDVIGSFRLGPYTFATVPSASANSGATIRITDRAQKQAYSDGTDWRFTGTDAIIS